METRPTAMYQVPWQTARQERLRRSLGKLQAPTAPRTASTQDDRTQDGGRPADRADVRWPSLIGRGPRHVPVVGPTEALRGRAGGPGVDVPPGAVPGLLDHERESGWQLAQRVWQDSGVDWEDDAPVPAQLGYAASGPYAPGPYAPDPYAADPYGADRYPVDPYPVDPYSAEAYSRPFGADAYGPGSYPADADAVDLADPYPVDGRSPAHQYSAAPYAASQYLTDPHPTRPDLPVLREPVGSLLGMGPWPVQQEAKAPRPEPPVAEPQGSAEQPDP
ncbi:MAG: hypothetical protein ACRDP7_22095, partial [Trebonia sp.]